MTGVLTSTGHLWPSTYPIRVRSRGRPLGKGHLWSRGPASFARALPRKNCGLPEARLLHPRQSDLRRIHIPVFAKVLEVEGAHRAGEADMQFGNLAFGERVHLHAGKAQALVDPCDVLLCVLDGFTRLYDYRRPLSIQTICSLA